jgi:hypothetical protein
MNFQGESIAMENMNSMDLSVDATLMEIMELRKCCSQALPIDITQRIRAIRDICKEAEAADGNGQVSWRKAGNGGGHGHGHGHGRGNGHGNGHNGHSYKKGYNHGHGSSSSNSPSGNEGGAHRWRVGKPQTSSDKPLTRYVSKFKNTETPVENTILNVLILNKLNNFADKNYEEVKGFLEQVLDGDEKDFLKDFMTLVFNKASMEPTFCPLYAKLLSELSVKYDILLVELNSLYTTYMNIFEEVTEEQCASYEQFVQRNREKQCRMGYSQFLAELTSAGILEPTQLEMLYSKVIDQVKLQASKGESKIQLVEQLVDCLLRMTKAFQKNSVPKLAEIRNHLKDLCEPKMEEILAKRSAEYPGLSKKGAFAVMDCLDIFRENTTRK